MQLTEEQKKKYVDDGGVACPYCSGEELLHEPSDEDVPTYQRVECLGCGKVWSNEYSLTGIVVHD